MNQNSINKTEKKIAIIIKYTISAPSIHFNYISIQFHVPNSKTESETILINRRNPHIHTDVIHTGQIVLTLMVALYTYIFLCF